MLEPSPSLFPSLEGERELYRLDFFKRKIVLQICAWNILPSYV